MSRACIAVVDASCARLFTFDRTSGFDGIHDQLVEERDLVDPGRRLRSSELFSESRPGASRTGDLGYAFDDHRDAHVDAMDAEFARTVITEVEDLIRATATPQLIVCASPHMLGELRAARRERLTDGLVIEEIPRDLVKLTTPELREQLASYGLLPPLPPRPGLHHRA